MLLVTFKGMFCPDSYVPGKVKLIHCKQTCHLDLKKFCAEPCKCQGLIYGVGLEMSTDNLETLKYHAPDCSATGRYITAVRLPPPVVKHKAPGKKTKVPAPGCHQSPNCCGRWKCLRKERLSGIIWKPVPNEASLPNLLKCKLRGTASWK